MAADADFVGRSNARSQALIVGRSNDVVRVRSWISAVDAALGVGVFFARFGG
jgi:hypothetical protein